MLADTLDQRWDWELSVSYFEYNFLFLRVQKCNRFFVARRQCKDILLYLCPFSDDLLNWGMFKNNLQWNPYEPFRPKLLFKQCQNCNYWRNFVRCSLYLKSASSWFFMTSDVLCSVLFIFFNFYVVNTIKNICL